eukprot:scaffold112021_cov77-Cyclotella_meneghiniana.AAC.1
MDREIFVLVSAAFTAKLWTIGQVDASHSSWTVPMSHFKWMQVTAAGLFQCLISRSADFTVELWTIGQVDASHSSWT